MARDTRFLVVDFVHRLAEAQDLAVLAEASSNFQYVRRFHIYEAAYLLAFSAWESFLEQAFLRFMCGYSNTSGVPAPTTHWQRRSTIGPAYATLLAISPNKPQYLLWHGPSSVIQRSRMCFAAGSHELVISSAKQDIED